MENRRIISVDQKTQNPTPIEYFVEELSIPIGVYCLSWIIKHSEGDDSIVFQYFSTEQEALNTAKIHYIYGSDYDDEMRLMKLVAENKHTKSNTFFWRHIEMDFSDLKTRY